MTALFLLQTPSSVWAAEADAAQTDIAVEEAEEVNKKLTLEEAQEKAKKHSANLRNTADTAEYLQELKEDIWDSAGSFTVPTATYQKWVNDETYSLYTSIQSISSNMLKNRYSEEITKISLEATVKNDFISILSSESSLELAKETEEIQKILYQQGKEKYDYGMISEYQLRELKSSYETAQDQVASIEKTLKEQYRAFYQTLGENEDAEYTLVYDVEYEPYTMNQTMDQYINERLKQDYTILQLQQNVEDAEFNMNYLSESTTNADTKTKKYNYKEASRQLKTAKEDKELAIKNAYDAILSIEDSYVSAEKALENAKSNLELAELNYELGKITEISLRQTEMTVEQAENELQQIIYAHDLKVYQFENTELLS